MLEVREKNENISLDASKRKENQSKAPVVIATKKRLSQKEKRKEIVIYGCPLLYLSTCLYVAVIKNLVDGEGKFPRVTLKRMQ